MAYAHRGGAEEAPENTLPAFESAVELGYRYVETDVHTSRDGVVFAFHDPRLDRVTDRRGRIAALTAADVEMADAGFHFTTDAGATHPFRDRGVRVPRLEHLLERWPDLRINIDPKADRAVEPVLALLRRLGAFDRVCIGCFSDLRLARVRRRSGGLACTSMGPAAVTVARLASAGGRLPRQGARCLQVPRAWWGIPVVDRTLLRAAHASGLPVHVWTVDEEAEMHQLLDLGVDGLMSDRPRLLRDVLRARGQWTGAGSAEVFHRISSRARVDLGEGAANLINRERSSGGPG